MRHPPQEPAFSLILQGFSLARLADIDGSSVERGLEVGGVVFLDHLDAGPAVLGDLTNVRPSMSRRQMYLWRRPYAVRRLPITDSKPIWTKAAYPTMVPFFRIAGEI